ncbi:MAG: hypothetical protein Q8882_01540 [Bacillota bacterium]|nr:hypothetical protein [Bacillota bacterium]
MTFLWVSKDIWECIYYVSFIVLTAILAFYTGKTYLFQSSKHSNLLCKLSINEATAFKANCTFSLEIYNFGNDIIKNVSIKIADKDFAFVDFLKPNESYYLPLGYIISLSEKNFVMLFDNNLKENEQLKVSLEYSNESKIFLIDTKPLHNMTISSNKGSEKISDSLEKISKELSKIDYKVIAKSIDSLKDKVEGISKKIK